MIKRTRGDFDGFDRIVAAAGRPPRRWEKALALFIIVSAIIIPAAIVALALRT